MPKMDQDSIARGIVLDTISKSAPNISFVDANKIADEVVKSVPIYTQDKWFYRGVAISLAVIVGIVLVGGIILIGTGHEMSEAMIALGSAAVGGLVGIFATSK